jgi:hypothetical protein
MSFTFYDLPLVNNLTWYQFRVTLSGAIYTLNIRYNTRMARWTMDIEDSAANVILAGVTLLINRDLTGQYLYLSIPPGVFFALDNTNTDTEPTQFSFGTTNSFVYGDPN